ncbi:MAG: glycosyltransferase [Cyanobacteria bacterium J06632_3]
MRLLLGDYDIWHRHWPSRSLNHSNPVKALLKVLAAVICTLIARLKGTRIVWTIHNIGSHEQFYPKLERLYWQFFIAQLDGYISLSESALCAARKRYPRLHRLPGAIVPHIHYREHYQDTISSTEARKQLNIPHASKVVLLIGKLRSYKNVPALIETFRHIDDPQSLLYIVGQPANEAVAASIAAAGQNARGIRLVMAHVAEDDIQLYLRAANLVVLPYREILNSGSALLALSFDCPILVPELGSLGELQGLVGDSWVMTYTKALTPQTLREGLTWATETVRSHRAPLDNLDSKQIAYQTIDVYQDILDTGTLSEKLAL